MTVGQPERATQNRVIALFRDELGYRYLGDFSEREGNSHIEDAVLGEHLRKVGYSAEQISRAIYLLHAEASPARATTFGDSAICSKSSSKALGRACKLNTANSCYAFALEWTDRPAKP